MSETQEYIGKTHSIDLPRDAVHIAVVQVTGNVDLKPGEHIGLVSGSVNRATNFGTTFIGIVDPFLAEEVKKDTPFYMFLYPNTVEGLTHHYIHWALDSDDPKVKARHIIIEWIKSWYYSYSNEEELNAGVRKMYKAALDSFKDGEEFDFDGSWRNENDMDYETFEEYMKPVYDSLEILTGRKATTEERQRYYSCCV